MFVAATVLVAVGECATPAQGGLALCFPSVGSTVLYPATIEMAVNSGGVPITSVSVYDGNVRVDSSDFFTDTLIDFGIRNGFHRITVNAWDANGKLYQAKTSFTITGFGYGPCPEGSAALTVCEPSQGSYQPAGSTLISAYFGAGVRSWSMALDGVQTIDSSQSGLPVTGPVEIASGGAAGKHTLTVRAVNANGTTSTVTRQFSSFYNLNCSPKGNTCTPGILITQPNNLSEDSAADEGTHFQLHAEVMYNTKPTTKMIVYLDGAKVEQSAGPGITANLNPTKGSHYIVVLAWDTTGNLYETYGNVNVQ